MPFKPRKTTSVNFEKPQDILYNSSKRKIEGVLDHQTEVLDLYLENNDEKDLAFELPTGSGKTLIGLLIAEYRRLKSREQVLYLCPTRQLVMQVVEEAQSKYGINAVPFIGSKNDFNQVDLRDFKSSKLVGVTTYSGLFNANPEFSECGLLIFDDAHTSDNYISNYFSLKINREVHADLYTALVEVFKPLIDLTFYERMLKQRDEIYLHDMDWVDMLPSPKLADHIGRIFQVIEAHLKSTQDSIKFQWHVLMDHLSACNIFLSYDEILIKPFIPPTLSHAPFARANQRIYMSATLGTSGELERVTGISKIKRIPIPSQWKKHANGRRFFVFPELKLGRVQIWDHLGEVMNETPRALIITKNNKEREGVVGLMNSRVPNATFFTGKDLEENQTSFIESNPGLAVVSNRLEGLNFPGDECRILVLNELSKTTNLQERFMISRMAVSIIFHERIRTRIIQAAGRCTRSPLDYAVVYVIGSEFMDELLQAQKQIAYHPEFQAELEFGHEQSKNVTDASDLLDMIKIFLHHGEEWSEIEEDIKESRDEKLKAQVAEPNASAMEKLGKSSKYEVQFLYSLWEGDYEQALKHAVKVLENLDGNDVKGYRAFWYYQAGSVCYNLANEGKKEFILKYQEYFKNAAASSFGVTWLKTLKDFSPDIKEEEISLRTVRLIEGIEKSLVNIGAANVKKMESLIIAIGDGLKQTDGKKFENAHLLLGRLIGFIAENPKDNASPDPFFIVGNLCLVFEDKILTSENKILSVANVRQASGHEAWIRQHVDILPSESEIITCIISNANFIEKAARTFASDIYFWPLDDFQSWYSEVIRLIRQLSLSFTGAGDANWRAQAAKTVYKSALDPDIMKGRIINTPLLSLPDQ